MGGWRGHTARPNNRRAISTFAGTSCALKRRVSNREGASSIRSTMSSESNTSATPTSNFLIAYGNSGTSWILLACIATLVRATSVLQAYLGKDLHAAREIGSPGFGQVHPMGVGSVI